MYLPLKYDARKLAIPADWFDDAGHIAKAMARELTEELRETFKNYPPLIDISGYHGTITVSLNLSNNEREDGYLRMKIDFDKMIQEFIECTDPEDMEDGNEERADLAKRLRIAADEIEKARNGN